MDVMISSTRDMEGLWGPGEDESPLLKHRGDDTEEDDDSLVCERREAARRSVQRGTKRDGHSMFLGFDFPCISSMLALSQ